MPDLAARYEEAVAHTRPPVLHPLDLDVEPSAAIGNDVDHVLERVLTPTSKRVFTAAVRIPLTDLHGVAERLPMDR